MRLFLMFLPWLELFTLIQLGIQTSALFAVFYVMATLFLGVAILRRQGRDLFEQARQAQQGRVIGTQWLVDDMAMGLAALLLVFPGLITDLAALVVMVGPLRRRLARALGAPEPEVFRQYPGQETGGVIEGEFRRVDETEVN